MEDAVLVLNAGSSSLKFGLFTAAQHPRPLFRGLIEGIGDHPRLTARDGEGAVVDSHQWDVPQDFDGLLSQVLGWVDSHLDGARLVAVGHRIVHGGERDGPQRITPALLDTLERLSPLAPLHQPHNLAPIRSIAALRPGLTQVASFDTAFHRTMPDLSTRFALPESFHARGIRRYGFHGLSYAYLARRLAETDPDRAGGRWVLMHLGSGASLCALMDGRSVDTTMGMTALDGLVMGTRCGSIDPGVVLHLLGDGMTAAEVGDLLSRRSGLLGVSSISADMRVLQASRDPAAQRAIALFVRGVLVHTGGLAAIMGGLDGVVFSGGIGEHSAPVRAAIAEGLGWLGGRLDPVANAAGAPDIAARDSVLALRIIPTDEEVMIAEETVACLH